jgi:hypothetical protein
MQLVNWENIMSHDSFQARSPHPKQGSSTSISEDVPDSQSNSVDGTGPLPSIVHPRLSCTEYFIAIGLIATSPMLLAICYLTRTGHDLTVPFFAGQGLVLLIGTGVLLIGIFKADMQKSSFGVASILLTLGIASLAGSYDLWIGSREMQFSIEVKDKNGKPVPEALVKFGDKHDVFATQTGRDGMATFTRTLTSIGKSSPVCDTGYVRLFTFNVKVSAEGYEDFERPVHELLGFGWPIHQPPPPALQIQLIAKR